MRLSPALDLFCGLGGWTAGAARTGGRIEVRAALDHNARAIEHYSTAHAGVAHFCQDAAEFNFAALRDLVGGGYLLASPSCRDFSSAGRPAAKGVGGNGTVDLASLSTRRTQERNTMWAAVCAVEALEPHTALFENVTQVYDWPLFPAWRLAMEALGYTVREHTLNAADYGGATDRKRAFITLRRGSALDLAPTWGGPSRCVADCLDDDDSTVNKWREVDGCVTRTRELIRTRQDRAGLRRGILNNVGDGVRLRCTSDLAPTLTTKSGSQLMLVDGDRVRILNPMELARISGWTDGEVSLPTNRDHASVLIGNAIPMELAHGVCAQAVT